MDTKILKTIKMKPLEETKYVQYGCGTTAPDSWTNFDVSPVLKVRENILLNLFVLKLFGFNKRDFWDKNVRFGDIVKGLPIQANSCYGVYCSHVLEHLTLTDFHLALENTYSILKDGGIFRLVLPDLEYLCRTYINQLENGDVNANGKFMSGSFLGHEAHPSKIRSYLRMFYYASYHFWMWDRLSLMHELKSVGFRDVRQCQFGDSNNIMFNEVEIESRFKNAVAFECIK